MSKALRRLSYIDVAQAQQRKQQSSTSETANVPNSGAPKLGTPESAATIDTDVAGAPNLGAPDIATVTAESDAILKDESFVYRAPLPPPRLAISAQDGHTHGEQNLLATLWRLAKPTRNGTARMITIGERTLAKQVAMSYSTVQANIRSLINKMAIEVRNEGLNKPKTYLIFNYDEILRRRQAAGLTHVVRRTNGVLLVNANSGAPNTGAPLSGVSY